MAADSANSSFIDIDERLEFMNIDRETKNRLNGLKPLLKDELGPALSVFYKKVNQTPQTSRFFSSDQQMSSAKGRQEQHWQVIADGEFGQTYAQAVRSVGKTHARLGLEPRWYIGGYALVLEQLIHAVVKDRMPRFMYRGQHVAVDMAATLSSLVKAAMLDMDLSISIYLEELDRQVKQEQELRERAQRNQFAAIDAIAASLTKLASGNLAHRLDAEVAPEFEQLKADFNDTVEKLRDAFMAVHVSTSTIGAAINEIAVATDDLARRTEAQAARFEESSAALTEATETIKATADISRQTNEIVAATKLGAEKGGGIVIKAMEAMGQIEKSSRDIGQIVGVIDEIAFQTNLLALNAGVEAARAGEAGRGFAVVASEVRALAQRSAEAAKEITGLISASDRAVEEGATLVRVTGASLHEIVQQVGSAAEMVSRIASGARDQAASLSQISEAIGQMDEATQHTAAMVEQTTAATMSLREQTQRLSNSVDRFDIGHRSRTGGQAQLSRPALKNLGSKAGAAVRKPSYEAEAGGWEEF